MDDIQLTFNKSTTARISPGAGFCCVSWAVDGKEHLHLPLPEAEFIGTLKTGGVPLLYPFANRLRSDPWPGREDVKRDDGVPCHGFLLRFSSWDDLEVESHRAVATLDWANHEELMSLFPHAHRLRVTFELGERSLEATTSIEANGGDDVPVSFGWHPYLTIPGMTHDDLELVLPDLQQVQLDGSGIPIRTSSGDLVLDAPSNVSGSLASRSFDNLYRLETPGSSVELRGGGSGIKMDLDSNWGFIQLYSPEEAAFAAIEPMTAPVAALSDSRDLRVVKAGDTFEATFKVSEV